MTLPAWARASYTCDRMSFQRSVLYGCARGPPHAYPARGGGGPARGLRALPAVLRRHIAAGSPHSTLLPLIASVFPENLVIDVLAQDSTKISESCHPLRFQATSLDDAVLVQGDINLTSHALEQHQHAGVNRWCTNRCSLTQNLLKVSRCS